MNTKELKAKLDEAMQGYNTATRDTLAKYHENEDLKSALGFVYEDTFRCLSDFESAILEALEKH